MVNHYSMCCGYLPRGCLDIFLATPVLRVYIIPYFSTHVSEQSIQPTKTVSDSQTMTSGASYTFKPIQVPHTAAIPSSSPPAATKFPDLITSAVENSQNAVKCSLTLLAILLTNILVVMFYL